MYEQTSKHPISETLPPLDDEMQEEAMWQLLVPRSASSGAACRTRSRCGRGCTCFWTTASR